MAEEFVSDEEFFYESNSEFYPITDRFVPNEVEDSLGAPQFSGNVFRTVAPPPEFEDKDSSESSDSSKEGEEEEEEKAPERAIDYEYLFHNEDRRIPKVPFSIGYMDGDSEERSRILSLTNTTPRHWRLRSLSPKRECYFSTSPDPNT